jgi:hypothetical protein
MIGPLFGGWRRVPGTLLLWYSWFQAASTRATR